MSDTQPQPRFTPPPQGRRQPGWKVWCTRQALRALGWRIRGNMPIQFWRTTLVVYAPLPWQLNALRMAMPIQTARLAIDEVSPRRWAQAISQHIDNRQATAVHLDPNLSQLEDIVTAARSAKTRITCAHGMPNENSFTSTPIQDLSFPDRDLHYIRRYFGYFSQQMIDIWLGLISTRCSQFGIQR